MRSRHSTTVTICVTYPPGNDGGAVLTTGDLWSKSIIAAVFLSVFLFQGIGSSQSVLSAHNVSLVPTAVALGQHGDLIAHAREQTLQILQAHNTHTAWFQKAGPSAAEVFRSLRYRLDGNGRLAFTACGTISDRYYSKHPWGAKSTEYAGSNSIVQINGNGSFFARKLWVAKWYPPVGFAPPGSWQFVIIGPYVGDTPEAGLGMMWYEGAESHIGVPANKVYRRTVKPPLEQPRRCSI